MRARPEVLAVTAFLGMALCNCAAWAETKVAPTLNPLPDAKLAELGPLLRGGDFVLIESDERGWERQVTALSLVAAAPEVVREIVIHPERYPEFVRNMQGSTIKKNADGSFDHTYKLSYTVASFSGT